ncbi:DUF2521 family protein [Camelliibacillus cellulosilyticus]|uniref:DUF2521 family protein n=1 Tax=Camelliibacillus cellulosilyticus TaxID=2174486 RepID=A0ABV9GQJ7_9BACL
MGSVMSFQEKYRHKQLDFERKALSDLSIPQIEAVVNDYFDTFLEPVAPYRTTITDMCLDYAIESYLLGASYGRFGYYGEPPEMAFTRSLKRSKILTHDLFDFWLFWYIPENTVYESLFRACEAYLYYWWKEGFENAVRRYRLRLN